MTGCQRTDCPRRLSVHFSAWLCALRASKPALFTSCFVFLTLSPPAFFPLPVFVSLPLSLYLLLALSGSDDSSGVGMKVTQGNKGPAVPWGGGGGVGEQHPGTPGCLLGAPAVCSGCRLPDPQGTRCDASGSCSLLIAGSPHNSVAPQLLLQWSCGVSAASYIPALEHCGSSWRRTKGWGSVPPLLLPPGVTWLPCL